MKNINYKKLFTQKVAHREFIQKIESLDLKNIDENQDESLLNLLNFLNDWLVEHILKEDKLINY